jgi:hypothetical protein
MGLFLNNKKNNIPPAINKFITPHTLIKLFINEPGVRRIVSTNE